VCQANVEAAYDDEVSTSEESSNSVVRCVVVSRAAVHEFLLRRQAIIKASIIILLAVLYVVYFGCAMYHNFGDEGSIRLLWVTCVVVVATVISATNRVVRDKITLTSQLPAISDAIIWLQLHSRLSGW